jgi:hypothetical protein
MPTLLNQGVLTPTTERRLAACLTPEDRHLAIRAGIIISYDTFTTRQGQPGDGIMSHTTRRAGVCLVHRPLV